MTSLAKNIIPNNQTDYTKGKCMTLDKNWLDPTPEMLEDPVFSAIWSAIRKWDINVPDAYEGYCGATGNHARAIYDALNKYESAKTQEPNNVGYEKLIKIIINNIRNGVETLARANQPVNYKIFLHILDEAKEAALSAIRQHLSGDGWRLIRSCISSESGRLFGYYAKNGDWCVNQSLTGHHTHYLDTKPPLNPSADQDMKED